MKKITSIYYLNYPDKLPDDPRDAYSELYVEIGNENSTINNFEATFAFHVYTKHRVNSLIGKGGYAVFKSAIVVDSFEDSIIEKAIENILEDIEEYGLKVGS